MRCPLLFAMTGPSAGATLQIEDVKASYFRNFWFRSSWGGASYTLDCYASKADAQTQTGKLATATHATGRQTVTLTVAPGAPFDPTPMTVVVTTLGTWTSAIVGWVDDPENELVDRIAAIIEVYRGANERLASVREIRKSLLRPSAGLPAIGIVGGREADYDQDLGAPRFTDRFTIELYVWDSVLDNETTMKNVVSLAGALRSIALDEQRRWGGLVLDTRATRPIELGIVQPDDGSFVYEGRLSLELQISELAASMTVGGQVADGGKYVAGM